MSVFFVDTLAARTYGHMLHIPQASPFRGGAVAELYARLQNICRAVLSPRAASLHFYAAASTPSSNDFPSLIMLSFGQSGLRIAASGRQPPCVAIDV